jgi:hypothetical protein
VCERCKQHVHDVLLPILRDAVHDRLRDAPSFVTVTRSGRQGSADHHPSLRVAARECRPRPTRGQDRNWSTVGNRAT